MLDMKLIGKRLKTARENIHYSQQDVADLVGKSREQISYYETGSRQINLSLLTKLSSIYGKSLDYFIVEDLCEEPEMQVAYRSDDISKNDLKKIEWVKNFVNNLYEIKHLY